MKNFSKEQNRGFVMLTVVIIFLFITLGSAFSLSSVVFRQSAIVRNNERSAQSIIASESLQEDVLYRLIEDKKVSPVETMVIGGAQVEAVIEDTGGNIRVISEGDAEKRIRKSEMVVSKGGSGVVFFYGVQSGVGGIELRGSSMVEGDLYSNGPIVGAWSTRVTGNATSAGPGGLIKDFAGVGIDGSAYANRIENSRIGGDAYYQTIDPDPPLSWQPQVEGTRYPGSPDMPTRPLPITDEEIEEWKSEAEAGGVYTGPCNIDGVSEVSIGNVRMNCDLTIGGSAKVTITGPIWVRGNISFQGSSITSIAPELEGKTVTIVADDPSNRMNKGRISVGGSASVRGAGDGSFVVLVSQNESAEKGGNTVAIDVGGGGPHNDIIVYAGHGLVTHGGSASVPVGVNGYKVIISGSARIQYDDGAASLELSNTPAGGYRLQSFREIQ